MRHNQGYTLLELVMVIAMMGIAGTMILLSTHSPLKLFDHLRQSSDLNTELAQINYVVSGKLERAWPQSISLTHDDSVIQFQQILATDIAKFEISENKHSLVIKKPDRFAEDWVKTIKAISIPGVLDQQLSVLSSYFSGDNLILHVKVSSGLGQFKNSLENQTYYKVILLTDTQELAIPLKPNISMIRNDNLNHAEIDSQMTKVKFNWQPNTQTLRMYVRINISRSEQYSFIREWYIREWYYAP